MQGALLTFEATSAQRRRALIAVLRHNYGEKNTAYLLMHYDQTLLLDRVHMQRMEHTQETHTVSDQAWAGTRNDYSRFLQKPITLDLVRLLEGLLSDDVVAHDVARISGMDPTIAMIKLGLPVDGEAIRSKRFSDKVRRVAPSDEGESIIEGFVRAIPQMR